MLPTLRTRDWLLTRRHLLQAAAASLTLWVPGLAVRAAEQRGAERQKSLITVWLSGGASQLETWDPHPGSPIGGPTLGIDTTIKGVQIAANYPQLAEQLEHLSVVRSLVSLEGDHERGMYMAKTGYRPEPTIVHPSTAAVIAFEKPDPRLEIPLYVALGDVANASRAGFLGGQYDPFQISDPGNPGENILPSVDSVRQNRRMESLQVVGKAFSRGRKRVADQTLHEHTVQAALTMMRSEQLKAFDLSQESAQTAAAYGTSPFGRGCLVARRLVEQGVRSIEVGLGGFDGHAENFSIHTARASVLDPALSALVKDLRERDLWDSTVLLVMTEFGRTPQVNPLDGRDHWPNGFSCLVGGGGLGAGRVIGSTDPFGKATAPEHPVKVADLTATVLHQLGVDYAREVMTPIGRPIQYCAGTPVPELLVT